MGLHFRPSVEGFHLFSFADADYASKATDRRSVSGGVVMCAGGAVSWYQVLKDSEMRHAANHAGRVCSDVGWCGGDFVFEASLAFHVAEDRYAMHPFV